MNEGLGPLETAIVEFVEKRRSATPKQVIAHIRKESVEYEAPATVRLALDRLASRGLIERTPRNFAEEPERFTAIEAPWPLKRSG